jgi:hypothetical protein
MPVNSITFPKSGLRRSCSAGVFNTPEKSGQTKPASRTDPSSACCRPLQSNFLESFVLYAHNAAYSRLDVFHFQLFWRFTNFTQDGSFQVAGLIAKLVSCFQGRLHHLRARLWARRQNGICCLASQYRIFTLCSAAGLPALQADLGWQPRPGGWGWAGGRAEGQGRAGVALIGAGNCSMRVQRRLAAPGQTRAAFARRAVQLDCLHCERRSHAASVAWLWGKDGTEIEHKEDFWKTNMKRQSFLETS